MPGFHGVSAEGGSTRLARRLPHRVAAGDHNEPVLKLDPAAVELAARRDLAALAFASQSVPIEDVRIVLISGVRVAKEISNQLAGPSLIKRLRR